MSNPRRLTSRGLPLLSPAPDRGCLTCRLRGELFCVVVCVFCASLAAGEWNGGEGDLSSVAWEAAEEAGGG